ncbi:MAG: hypothetical protein ACI9SE_001124 [Neolewinella sp.]|jgi:hypothetical protein
MASLGSFRLAFASLLALAAGAVAQNPAPQQSLVKPIVHQVKHVALRFHPATVQPEKLSLAAAQIAKFGFLPKSAQTVDVCAARHETKRGFVKAGVKMRDDVSSWRDRALVT